MRWNRTTLKPFTHLPLFDFICTSEVQRIVYIQFTSDSFVELRLIQSSRMLSAWQRHSRHLSATNTLVSACVILSLPLVVSNQSICQRTEYQGDTATSASQSVENQRFKLKV